MVTYTKQKYRNAFYDCDHLGRMKISSILKVTAEVAGYDYVLKGFNHEFLWERGFVFLLSRISIKINSYPTDQTELETCTWEGGKKGAMFKRQYRIFNGDEVCVEGTSGWILCNPETRKIYKPSEFPFPQEQDETQIINALEVGRIKAENEAEFVYNRTVAISDLDSNGHVYNANYADIAVDALTMEEYANNLDNFRINYLSEAVLGDTISVYKSVCSDKKIVVTGFVEKSGEKTPCFECEFIFK